MVLLVLNATELSSYIYTSSSQQSLLAEYTFILTADPYLMLLK